jgi:DNA-binding transcriptional ArsR family regulator
MLTSQSLADRRELRQTFGCDRRLCSMTVLRFGPGDALRCRFLISPAWESQAAARLFLRHEPSPIYDPWIEEKRHAAAAVDLEVLHMIQPRIGHSPDFLAPPPRSRRPDFAVELARIRATPIKRVVTELRRSRDMGINPRAADVDKLLADPAGARERLADALEAVWTVLVAPDWVGIKRALEDDIAYRGGQLTEGGLAALFDELHPALRWHDNQLTAAHSGDADRDLGGGGLLLIPSVFAWPHLAVMTDPAYQPTVVYPARGAARLWTDTPAPPDRLATLMGRTRATVLAALDPPATPSDLAHQYGLALGTVAEHLKALHGAGLANRRRDGHKVRYRRTDLGQAVLDASLE